MRMNRAALVAVTVAIMAMLLITPLISVDSDATEDPGYHIKGVTIIPDNKNPDVTAGKTVKIVFSIYNESANHVRITISASCNNEYLTVTTTSPEKGIEPGGYGEGTLNISANQYVGDSIDKLDLVISVTFLDGVETLKETMSLKLHSSLSYDAYNKILGVWANPLPAPFNSLIWTVVITLAILMAIGFILIEIAMPLVLRILIRHDPKEARTIVRRTRGSLYVLSLLFAVSGCLVIAGADRQLSGMFTTITDIGYIVIIAFVLHRVAGVVIESEIRYRSTKSEYIDDSLTPLCRMLSTILIAVGAFSAILMVFGLNLMVIATGAGVLGLALSLGAQNTLSQFISGLSLLINRPFKPEDRIKIGTAQDIMIVERVGVMNTTLKSWANSEIYTIPNNNMATATIINLSKSTTKYRIAIVIGVAYGSDVALSKKLALDAMKEHPRIIQDGSEEYPMVRLNEFGDYSLNIRVSGYVDDFEDNFIIAGEIREAIYRKYTEAGISIPFPQRDLWIKNLEDLKK